MSTEVADAGELADAGEGVAHQGPRPLVLVLGVVVALVLITVGALSLLQSAPAAKNASRNALIGEKLDGFGAGLPLVDGHGDLVAPWTDGRAGVILFFARWCAPCRAEVPVLADAVGAGLIDGAQVEGVDEDDALGTARAFIRQSGVRFPVGQDSMTQLAELLVPAGLPAAVFVRSDGKVAEVHYGTLSASQLRSGVAEMVP